MQPWAMSCASCSSPRTRTCTRSPAPAAGAVQAVNTGSPGVWITVAPSSDEKCVRCWHQRADVGSDARHPLLCARCVSNVEGPGEPRQYA